MAGISAKERKEIARSASESRAKAQRDKKDPRARWCVDRWSLHLLQAASPPEGPIGTVVSVTKGACTVRVDGEDRACALIREIAERQQSEIAPGDEVRLEPIGEAWRVCQVLPRRTVLTRLDPHHRERERAIVANVDVVAIVVSVVAPPLHPRLIDRYLAAIHRGGAQAIVIVNKTDLHETAEDLATDLRQLDTYVEMGVPVMPVSTADGAGIDAVRAALDGRTAVFVGHSGVGKSSLLSALLPQSGAVAGAVSEGTGKGRHTTTGSTLVEMDGLRIVDTPGVREFAVEFGSPAEVADCFTEFQEAGRCRFGDCLHLEEPSCAVREAVRVGQISRARYRSYRRLLSDLVPEAGQEDDEPPERFECRHCGTEISGSGGGTRHRNHCPQCLHSVHVDQVPGDRAACCGGVMEPVAVWVRKGGEWAVIHRCRACGHLGSNRIAADDNEALLLSLAVKPLSQPAFPLDRLGARLV